jgi:hypothetical protein
MSDACREQHPTVSNACRFRCLLLRSWTPDCSIVIYIAAQFGTPICRGAFLAPRWLSLPTIPLPVATCAAMVGVFFLQEQLGLLRMFSRPIYARNGRGRHHLVQNVYMQLKVPKPENIVPPSPFSLFRLLRLFPLQFLTVLVLYFSPSSTNPGII